MPCSWAPPSCFSVFEPITALHCHLSELITTIWPLPCFLVVACIVSLLTPLTGTYPHVRNAFTVLLSMLASYESWMLVPSIQEQ